MAPTAARSRVGTSWIAARGRPASASPSRSASAMMPQLRKLSEPPRRIAALPALRQSAPASAVTLGRLSKITPITPSGVATRSKSSPFGVVQWASTRPTGSAQARHRLDTVGHRRNARLVEHEAVEEGRRLAGGARLRDVLRIGGEDARRGAAEFGRHGAQGAVLLRGGGKRQSAGGRTGRAPQLAHRPGDLVIDAAPVVRRWQSSGCPATVTPFFGPSARSQASGPSNRAMSSRWIISDRPRKPRTSSMARLLRPAMRTASPTS